MRPPGGSVTEARQLVERIENRRVRGTHGVEEIAGNDDEIRTGRDDVAHGASKCRGDIGLPLVDAGGGQAIVLAEAEMDVREVRELHREGTTT